MLVVSNVLLKMWGNHNQEEGDNSAVGYYLFMYGMLALGSALFAFTASVLLWVFCAIKSARSLHDAVRFYFLSLRRRKLMWIGCADAACRYSSTAVVLRANTYGPDYEPILEGPVRDRRGFDSSAFRVL